MEAEIERRVQRWINGACCERCWIDRNSHNEAGQLLVRQPAQMHSAGLRYCHFCGAATVMGILVRVPEGGS